MKAKMIKEEDKTLYNDYVASVSKGHVFQAFEWGELKAETGWEPIRFLVMDGSQIRGALSILKRAIPGIGKNIFYAPRGPVCDTEDHQVMDFMWKTTKTLAKEHGAIFLKIDPDIPVTDKAFAAYLKDRGFRHQDLGKNFEGIQPKFVFRLALDKSLDELFADLKGKTRYNVRYARRKGVEVIDETTKDDLQAFYDILEVTADRDDFMVRNYAYFEHIWEHLIEHGKARLFMAKYEGHYIAGTLAMAMGDKVWYIYGASANEYRNVMPNYLLQWHMIEWAHDMGAEIYDFRGVSGDLSEDNPLYGLYRFKKGFNGEFTEFIGEYDLVFSSAYYVMWTKGLPLFKKVRGKMLQILGK